MTHQMTPTMASASNLFFGSLEDVHYKEQHIIHFLLLRKRAPFSVVGHGRVSGSAGQQKFCGAKWPFLFWPFFLAPEFQNAKYRFRRKRSVFLVWGRRILQLPAIRLFLEVKFERKNLSSKVYGVCMMSSCEWTIFNNFLLLSCNPTKPPLGYSIWTLTISTIYQLVQGLLDHHPLHFTKKTPFGWFYIIYFTYLENPKIVAFVGEFRVIFQLLLFQFLHGCHQLGLLSQRPCNRSRTSFRFIPPTPQPDLRPFCVGFLTITTIWGVVVINCPDFWWILGKESCSSLPGLHKTKCFGTCFVYGKCVPLDPEWRMKWEQWWLWPTMPPALPPRT